MKMGGWWISASVRTSANNSIVWQRIGFHAWKTSKGISLSSNILWAGWNLV